jgi:hypothetical protein
MAISAVGSATSGSLLQLYRAEGSAVEGPRRGAAPSLAPVKAISPLAGREDADSAGRASADKAEEKREAERLGAKDPRGADSVVSRRMDERSAEVASQLAQLKSRDSEVRSHESAHMAAGGRYVTGGASYTYQKGPDGGQYAVGGEVGIDTSPVPGKPEETAQKMRIVRAAALAPSEPSGADIAVAAAAAQAEAAALAEIAQARAEELAGQAGGAPRREAVNMLA